MEYILTSGVKQTFLTSISLVTKAQFNYILLNESQLKGLRALASKQFFKVKQACLNEEQFPIVRLEEAHAMVVRYRELMYKAVKKEQNLLIICVAQVSCVSPKWSNEHFMCLNSRVCH